MTSHDSLREEGAEVRVPGLTGHREPPALPRAGLWVHSTRARGGHNHSRQDRLGVGGLLQRTSVECVMAGCGTAPPLRPVPASKV